jgi:putative phage-type endonuclease
MLDHDLRRQGITGSEIAEICGLSPFAGAGPHRVWGRKTGVSAEVEETPAMRRGKHMGPALCAWYAEETGMVVTHSGRHEATLRSEKHPLVIATPDGLIRKTRDARPIKVLEVKSPGRFAMDDWGEAGTDQIPEHYIPQVIWEMEAAGVRSADVVAQILQDDGSFPIYQVDWNEELFEALHEKAAKFWRDHVVTKVPPPVDGTPGARELLLRMYPHTNGELAEASDIQTERLLRYAEVRTELKRLEAEKEIIEQQMIAEIGGGKGVVSGAGKFTMIERAGSPAWKRIAEELGATEELISQHKGAGCRFPRWTAAKGDKP